VDLAISLRCGGRVAAPVTTTTDFLAPDIVNRHGRGSGRLLTRILRTVGAVNLSLTEAGGTSARPSGHRHLHSAKKPSPILTPWVTAFFVVGIAVRLPTAIASWSTIACRIGRATPFDIRHHHFGWHRRRTGAPLTLP